MQKNDNHYYYIGTITQNHIVAWKEMTSALNNPTSQKGLLNTMNSEYYTQHMEMPFYTHPSPTLT